MSYDRAKPIRYDIKQATLTSNATRTFIGPKGKKGRLLDYGIDGISTSTGGATNGPKVSVGTTGSAAAYGAAFDVGTLTAPSAKTVASTYHPSEAGYSTYMVNQVLPADTLVQLSIVAAAGSGNAGVGDAFMLIAWDD